MRTRLALTQVAIVFLATATLAGIGNATTITILDNNANEQVQILQDDKVVLTQIVEGSPLLYLVNTFPVHPPQTVFLTANLTEPGASMNISDTLRVILSPNNDMKTSTLALSFNSDVEGGLDGITGPGTQLIAELAAGNAVITDNAGFVDVNGKPVAASDFSGGGTLSIKVFSETEVPEPSSFLLCLVGSAVCTVVGRRRSKVANR